MTEREEVTFKKLILWLAETYRATLSPATFGGYRMTLGGLPIDDVEYAVRRAIRECKFMPPPAELYELRPMASGFDVTQQLLLDLRAAGEQSEAETSRLEAQFGKRLDSLDKAERDELAARCLPEPLLVLYQRGRKGGLIRQILLEAMT